MAKKECCAGCKYCIVIEPTTRVECARYPKHEEIKYIGFSWCGEYKERENKF